MFGLALDMWRPNTGASLTAQVQALFAGGKVGGMWDFGDIATLRQGGATSVTAVTQPIGIVLDKSQGLVLGSERVTNGDFSGGTTGWSAIGVTIGAGVCQFSVGGGVQELLQPALTIGKNFVLQFTVSNFVAAGNLRIRFGNESLDILPGITGNGTYYCYVAAAVDAEVHFVNYGTSSLAIAAISAKEIPGNHATQPTAGSRPLYQVVSSYGCAQFDGAADYLTCGSVDLSATDKVTVVAAMTLAASGNCGLVGFGNSAAGNFNVGYFSGHATWRASLYGSTGNAQTGINPADFPAIPHTKVVTVEFDLAGAASTDEAKFRLNGAAVTTDHIIGPAGGGNLANATLEIGRAQGVFVFNGNVHRLVVIGGGLSAAERRIVETYAAEGNGQTIP